MASLASANPTTDHRPKRCGTALGSLTRPARPCGRACGRRPSAPSPASRASGCPGPAPSPIRLGRRPSGPRTNPEVQLGNVIPDCAGEFGERRATADNSQFVQKRLTDAQTRYSAPGVDKLCGHDRSLFATPYPYYRSTNTVQARPFPLTLLHQRDQSFDPFYDSIYDSIRGRGDQYFGATARAGSPLVSQRSATNSASQQGFEITGVCAGIDPSAHGQFGLSMKWSAAGSR